MHAGTLSTRHRVRPFRNSFNRVRNWSQAAPAGRFRVSENHSLRCSSATSCGIKLLHAFMGSVVATHMREMAAVAQISCSMIEVDQAQLACKLHGWREWRGVHSNCAHPLTKLCLATFPAPPYVTITAVAASCCSVLGRRAVCETTSAPIREYVYRFEGRAVRESTCALAMRKAY